MTIAQQQKSQRRSTALSPVEFSSKKPRSLWSDAWGRLVRNKMSVVGLVIIGLFMLVGIFADILAPHDPIKQWPNFSLNDPVWITGDDRFLLGNDVLGRCTLSRLIHGARISMFVGLVPVALNILIGGTIGMISGYAGGRTDNLLMRITDVVFAFPSLLLLLLFVATFRDTAFADMLGGLMLIFVALAIVGWEGIARLMRGQVLSAKEKEYVEAARCIGVPTRLIMFRHILPNVFAPLLVIIAFGVPGAILGEAALSFLGLGIKPPIPSWGSMVDEGTRLINSQPMMVLSPAICIAIVLIAFTFVGDGLRDALDPKMKQ